MDPVRHLRFSLVGPMMIFNPASATVIEGDDILITLGEPAAIRNLESIAGGISV